MLLYVGTIEFSPLWRWGRSMTLEFEERDIIVMLSGSMLTSGRGWFGETALSGFKFQASETACDLNRMLD